MMHRESDKRPLRTSERVRFFSRAQTQLLAMLTTPRGCFFDTQGNLIPVLGVALSIERHKLMIGWTWSGAHYI